MEKYSGDDLEVYQMRIKDNYDSQMKRLQVLCEDEVRADQDVTMTLKFAYQGKTKANRAGTLDMKDRIEAALKDFGLVYTMIQDPESSFLNPVFVMFLVGPTRTILSFYEAIGDNP